MSRPARRLVILDRDGVINRDSDEFIRSPEEWIAIPGSLEAIGRLHRAGCRVVVATNQSGVGRGLFDLEELERIHAKMSDAVRRAGGRLDGIFFCPHRPDAGCECRKPRPGLLNRIAETLACDLHGACLVGDSERDIVAARRASVSPVLVRSGKGRRTLEQSAEVAGTPVFDDLAAFVDDYLSDEPSKR
jgi:D-glycero-D-manno-heptose 1,7-bisphosphate phosphatase